MPISTWDIGWKWKEKRSKRMKGMKEYDSIFCLVARLFVLGALNNIMNPSDIPSPLSDLDYINERWQHRQSGLIESSAHSCCLLLIPATLHAPPSLIPPYCTVHRWVIVLRERIGNVDLFNAVELPPFSHPTKTKKSQKKNKKWKLEMSGKGFCLLL